jgi:hypothetical protein
MSIIQGEYKKFAMIDNSNGGIKNWTYKAPKQGGANGAGEHGGFYESGNDRCLVKQDVRIPLNIAEFIAGKIYQSIVPEVSAKIKLLRVNDEEQISADGQNVYLVSEFIPGWKHDLYTEIQLASNRSAEHSKFKFKETLELTGQLLFRPRELTVFFQSAQKNCDLVNFGQVCATSLLLNNTDTNLGNLGVIHRNEGKKILGVIDYGAAFRNMTPKINPHSFKKYLTTHTYNREGWNNFMFYPESIKVTSEFVSELDKAAKKDLTNVVNEAFDDISNYYGIKPIVEFAIRAGVSERVSDDLLKTLAGDPQLAELKIKQIKAKILDALQKRQADLLRFSAQIKMDMCVQLGRASNQFNLNGSFVNTNKTRVTCNDVMFDHFDYFKEIMLEQEQFKFRKSTHKHQSKLIKEVKSKCITVCASFILADKNTNIRSLHNINSMDEAIKALQDRRLDKETLQKVLNNDLINAAREKLNKYEADSKQNKLHTVLNIVANMRINLTKNDDAYKRLEGNIELQEAIIELDRGCTQLSAGYNLNEKEALQKYKLNTLTLALQGAKNFKENYACIEAEAVQNIDHLEFIKFVRGISNLIVLALATASVVGVLALAITSGQRGGLLLFKGPQRDLSNIVSKFVDIQDDIDIQGNIGMQDTTPPPVSNLLIQ